jgi:TonB family protein
MKALAVVLLVAAVAANARAGQDDPLRTARDLYASAAYEEALSELARVRTAAAPSVDTARETDAYRAFCLVALGRTREAEVVVEALVRTDPMLVPDLRDASPRIEELFVSARKRVLPQLIRDQYRSARALAVQKAPDAEANLKQVKGMLAQAEQIGAWDDTLADLRVLVDGFLDLTEGQVASSAFATLPVVQPPDANRPAVSPDPARIYMAADAGVVAPVALSQAPPYVPPTLLDLVRRLRRVGAIDIVIDERGSVGEVVVRQSVNTAYDTLVVAAVRNWKYRPATKDGVPVRFVKTVLFDADAK